MSFNGSGTFSISTVGNPVQSDTTISPTVHNATMDEIAAGLTQCVTKDGQTTITQDLPMNGKKFTGMGLAAAASDAMNVTASMMNFGKYVYTVGGTVDAITLTPLVTTSSYQAGLEFLFLASGNNTGAATVNVNNMGIKSITKNGATALSAGDIVSGKMTRIIYDGTRFQLA